MADQTYNGREIGFDCDDPEDLDEYAADLLRDAATALDNGDRGAFDQMHHSALQALDEADEWRMGRAEAAAEAKAQARFERSLEQP